MSGIIVSDNTKGNKLHKGKGTPDGGEFTSGSEGGGASSSEKIKNTTRRGHLINPYYDKMKRLSLDLAEEIRQQEKEKGIKTPYERLTLLGEDLFFERYYNPAALKMIMEDTGYEEEEARNFQNTLLKFLGADYTAFYYGNRPNETKIIDAGIKRMPKYEGAIYRGSEYYYEDPDSERLFNKRIEQYKPGAIITLRNSPVSFTSSKDTAEQGFAKVGNERASSIVLICEDNKSGASVQHISEFGPMESEITVPSNTKYRVKDVSIRDKRSRGVSFKNPYNTKTVMVYLEEVEEDE